MRIRDGSSDVCSSDLAASIHPLALGDVARAAAGLALHRGSGLALALLGRLLVALALAGLGEDAGLLAGALEATEGKLERLVFADFDAGHALSRLVDLTSHVWGKDGVEGVKQGG